MVCGLSFIMNVNPIKCVMTIFLTVQITYGVRTWDDSDSKAVRRCFYDITHCKGVTLIASLTSGQAVIIHR